MIETVVHKWLKVPHMLHVGDDIHPKHSKLTVVLVHGLADSHRVWQPIITKLAGQPVRIITVDLLGFGDSPKPDWQTYSAEVHARSLSMTLRAIHVTGPVLLVGHSLGSLVSIQFASLFPHKVSSLLLCSPPFYKPPKELKSKLDVPQPDDMYRRVYSYTRSKTELAKRLALTIKKAKLLDESFRVDDATMPAIVSSLEMSIENQTSLQDAAKLSLPIHIIYGKLDPFIVKKNIRMLESGHSNITLETVIAGHEIASSKSYLNAIVAAIVQSIDEID